MSNKEIASVPMVSVVLPVYNVEPWLRECLDSLIRQTLRDIEILCINDGSTDHSLQILHEYEKLDSRIRIIDQENKGLSEARNTGIRAAKGKYIYFIDSDDVLESVALELCSEKMEQQKLEYLCFNAIAFGDDIHSAKVAGEKNTVMNRYLDEDLICSGQQLFSVLKQNKAYLAPAWLCMLLRSALLENNLWFHPSILHEDEPWTFTVLMALSRCGCLNRILYRRRIRDGSITQINTTFAHAYGYFAGFLDIQNLLRDHPELTQNKEYAEFELNHDIIRQKHAARTFLACNAEERQKYNSLDPVERLLFRQMVEWPASLIETTENQKKENQELRARISGLEKKIKEVNKRKEVKEKELKEILSSRSYRLGRSMLYLPGKLKGTVKKHTAVQRAVNKFRRIAGAVKAQKPDQKTIKNTIDVFPSTVQGNRIVYRYELSGEWQSCFSAGSVFEITYPFSMEEVPESIRIIPFLAQVLPVSWVCDAEIHVSECDSDFYNCLDSVKAGYSNMYPMISFGGKIIADQLVANASPEKNNRPLICFSGGVDATSTVLVHMAENPCLVSIWGADVPWKDEEGWKPIETLLHNNADRFGLDFFTIRSSFRDLLSVKKLGDRVKNTKDDWWHGFQHGLGILGHLAPAVWQTKAEKVYIASSFVAGDVYTCASDPTIDNYVRFCGAEVFHDGYDLNRQDKIRNIVTWATEKGVPVPLHVCWEKQGGDNCCHCEKCWRTMLGLYAEGADPRNFGFPLFEGFQYLSDDLNADYARFKTRNVSDYQPIQDCLKKRMAKEILPQELSWLCQADLSELENGTKRLYDGKLLSPFYLLCTPEHTNMGDHFIAEASKAFIQSFLPDRYIVEFTSRELNDKHFEQLNNIPPSQTIYIAGGGFVGSIWPRSEKNIEEIINRKKQNKIVILPQSIWFSDDNEGRKALDRAKNVYKGDRILLCCRDKVSLSLAQQHFDCPSLLVPDIALWEAKNPARPTERFGAMTMLRDDQEQVLTDAEKAAVESVLAHRFRSLVVSDMRLNNVKQVTKADRPKQMELLITRIASVECVVTDRLHGIILCALTGTPCVAFRNSYHKIEACYEWLKDIGYIRLIREPEELEEAVSAVCSCTDRTYPEKKMQQFFHPLIQYIKALELSV